MDISFCLDALEDAIQKYGKPEIMNTDQGSQFPSQAFTQYLKENEIRISKDAWRDNKTKGLLEKVNIKLWKNHSLA